MDDGRLSSMEVFQPSGDIKHHLQLVKKSDMDREKNRISTYDFVESRRVCISDVIKKIAIRA